MEKIAKWPRKVLLTTEVPYPQTDDVSNLIRHLTPHFEERNIQWELIYPNPKAGISLPGYPDKKLGFTYPAFFHNLNGEIIDVVHALAPTFIPLPILTFANIGAWALGWANERNIPAVASFNTNIPEYLKYYNLKFLSNFAWALYRLVHSSAQLNLAPSESIAAQMSEHKIKKVKVWGRGVDSKLFTPEKRNQDYRFKLTRGNPSRKILMNVGRLAREKNLEGYASLINTLPDVHFVFVGEGPRRNYLEKKFAGDNVTFTGALFEEELATAYASADIFTFTSLTEGTPNTVLEALASGLPVAAFIAPGVSEFIAESSAGILVDQNNWNDLAENVFLLVNNDGLRINLGIAGRKYAQTKTWKSCFEELLNQYQSVRKEK